MNFLVENPIVFIHEFLILLCITEETPTSKRKILKANDENHGMTVVEP